MKIIKTILVCAFICTQGWFPLAVFIEYLVRGNSLPFVTLGTMMGFAIMVMTLRDANGELLFQDARGRKIGWMTFFGFGLLKFLNK